MTRIIKQTRLRMHLQYDKAQNCCRIRALSLLKKDANQGHYEKYIQSGDVLVNGADNDL